MIKKKLVSLLVVLVFLFSIGMNVFATVGQQLTSPETGWVRFDDANSNITYDSTGWLAIRALSYYMNTVHTTTESNKTIRFNFTGSKIRLISSIYNDRPQGQVNTVYIDGMNAGCFSEYNSTAVYKVVTYELTNLSDTEHSCLINVNGAYCIDAVDIDGNSTLKPYSEIPTKVSGISAVAGNAIVNLSWTATTGSGVVYYVKRSLTTGGPYTPIATTSDISYPDQLVTNGTTYYYVISAVNSSGESTNSNEVSATPTAPTEPPVTEGNKAILEFTLDNGIEKEYDLTAAELLDFLSWYDDRSSGAGKVYYSFDIKNNIKPFLSRKEYIAFDKIQSFEVKEYNE